jgi:hypothetical protein
MTMATVLVVSWVISSSWVAGNLGQREHLRRQGDVVREATPAHAALRICRSQRVDCLARPVVARSR